MRGSPIRAIRKTSNDRIVSVSVTKKEKEKLSVHPGAQQPQGEEQKTSMPGAQQPQAHGNDEIVTQEGKCHIYENRGSNSPQSNCQYSDYLGGSVTLCGSYNTLTKSIP